MRHYRSATFADGGSVRSIPELILEFLPQSLDLQDLEARSFEPFASLRDAVGLDVRRVAQALDAVQECAQVRVYRSDVVLEREGPAGSENALGLTDELLGVGK